MAALRTVISAEVATNSRPSDAGPAMASSRITVQDEASQTEPVKEEKNTSFQPMRIYSRHQLLFLSNSPLIKIPPNMPELKDWFGDNDQNKKDSESTVPGSTRERRFRRDIEDGEIPSRPTFRSALSQPSQMGNFKHHSLRDRDRDRDRERDVDKDRERDVRDKEGQERLRHLSDKYDRDRLALPLAGLRSKEKDATAHLVTNSTGKAGAQAQGVPATSRRAEAREAAKRKAGEASEDWRRGAESRPGREDRSDTSRKDRDERDRPRSRVRDPSTSRRDRDRDDRDRARERDRDPDRDTEEDARRWRDDGRREERMAARRNEKNSEHYRERERAREKDPGWDTTSDRRWVPAEEREGRSKRATGRERKNIPHAEDGKERDDRRDRERERDKEPAWMETYTPTSSIGILGGKGGEGELDGIQAWKKEKKEKELKDQGIPSVNKGDTPNIHEQSMEKIGVDGKQLDEIQLFRLLMKREEEKKRGDTSDHLQVEVAESKSGSDSRSFQQLPTSSNVPDKSVTSSSVPGNTGPPQTLPTHALVQPEPHPTSAIVAPHSLLSIPGSKEPAHSTVPLETSEGSKASISSKAGSSPSPKEVPSQSMERLTLDSNLPSFNPPSGSRLLAFARTPSTARTPTNNSQGAPPNGSFQNIGTMSTSTSKSDLSRLPGFSPFEDQGRSSGMEGPRELGNFVHDAHYRGQERPSLTPSIDHGPLQDVPNALDNLNGYSTGKGSRFAKFFDGKGREGASAMAKAHTPGAIIPSSPGLGGQRQEHGFDGIHGGPDPRAMDDIYAMLNSSTQLSTRGASAQIPHSAPLSNNGSFGLQAQSTLQQQIHHQQMHSSRLEPLYESRLDDRNFMPDGNTFPGLRSAPPRNRDNVYSDSLDDGMHFNAQRLPQRALDQLYPGAPSPLYTQQGIRSASIPSQQSHYRGGPSPISSQQNLIQTNQQRLPPGLANLGGRPPHEPSQIVGIPGMSPAGLHGAPHLNGSAQQQPFSSLLPGSNIGYGGGPQIRTPQRLQNHGMHLPIGHPNNIDLRAVNQNSLLGVGNIAGLPGGGSGFPGQGPNAHIAGPLLTLRQPQQLAPHMMPHGLPHMQQGPNQPAHDLMALLMGGSHRE